MESLKNFIVENWQFISSGLLALLTIIAMLIKKKPQTVDDFFIALHQALLDVPYFIQSVEHPGDGFQKKIQVEQLVLNRVKEKLHRSLTKSETSEALIHIEDCIEEVLTTPQKKGVK